MTHKEATDLSNDYSNDKDSSSSDTPSVDIKENFDDVSTNSKYQDVIFEKHLPKVWQSFPLLVSK